nr:hypothetical protein [Lacinutrix neustonica]
MKKIATLVLVSVLGGAITLGAYKTILEKDEPIVFNEQQTPSLFTPVNLKTTNTARLLQKVLILLLLQKKH